MKGAKGFKESIARGNEIRRGPRERTLQLDERIFAPVVPLTPEVINERLAEMPLLIEGLPEELVKRIERIKGVLRLSPFNFELFTVAIELIFPTFEMALRYRVFQEACERTDANIARLKKGEERSYAQDPYDLFEKMGKGWRLEIFPKVSGSLKSLFQWAYTEKLLANYWSNARIEIFPYLRNIHAHGVSYSLEGGSGALAHFRRLIEFVNELFRCRIKGKKNERF